MSAEGGAGTSVHPKVVRGGSVISPDGVALRPNHDGRMSSYAVFWRNTGIAFHGHLELDPHGLWLRGASEATSFGSTSLMTRSSVSNATGRIGLVPVPAIRIQSRAAGSLLISSIGGAARWARSTRRSVRRLGAVAGVGCSGAHRSARRNRRTLAQPAVPSQSPVRNRDGAGFFVRSGQLPAIGGGSPRPGRRGDPPSWIS